MRPKTPAGRLEFLLDLFAPFVEREDGTTEREPSFGLISADDLLAMLDEPCPTSPKPNGEEG